MGSGRPVQGQYCFPLRVGRLRVQRAGSLSPLSQGCQPAYVFACLPSRATVPAMPSLLAALDAFMQEHRRCGDLDAGVEPAVVWMACDCGASIVHPVSRPGVPPPRKLEG